MKQEQQKTARPERARSLRFPINDNRLPRVTVMVRWACALLLGIAFALTYQSMGR